MIRRYTYLRALRVSLVAGAFYDLVFAGLMTMAPGPASRALGLPLPAERYTTDLLAILLAMLACLYLLAAREPRRYAGVVVVAIGGRALGAAAFALAAWNRPDLGALWGLAGADLAFALAHLLTWMPLRR